METLRSYRITPDQAQAKARAIITAHGPTIIGFDLAEYEARARWGHEESVRFRRGSEEVSLSIRFERELVEMTDGRSGPSVEVSVWRPLVQVGWSSTHRTPSRARAAAAFYAQVTDLACLLEATFEGEQVAMTREEERAAHEAAEAAARREWTHVRCASAEQPTFITLCSLSSLQDGALGRLMAEGLRPSTATCPNCLREWRERTEKARAKGSRQLKQGKEITGTWEVWESQAPDAALLFSGPYAGAKEFANQNGLSTIDPAVLS